MKGCIGSMWARGRSAILEALKAWLYNGQSYMDTLADAVAPVIWDSEAVGNACEGLKRCTSNKAWYELTAINNAAQLETANKSIPSGTRGGYTLRLRICEALAVGKVLLRVRFAPGHFDKHTRSFKRR